MRCPCTYYCLLFQVAGRGAGSGTPDSPGLVDAPGDAAAIDSDLGGCPTSPDPAPLPGPIAGHGASIAAADLNGDAALDLVVAHYTEGTVSVLLGIGSFQAYVAYPTGDFPLSVSIGKLDADGLADMVVANANTTPGTLTLFRGAGGGSFAPPEDVQTAVPYPRFMRIVDLDRDGISDLVASGDAGTGPCSPP